MALQVIELRQAHLARRGDNLRTCRHNLVSFGSAKVQPLLSHVRILSDAPATSAACETLFQVVSARFTQNRSSQLPGNFFGLYYWLSVAPLFAQIRPL